jgi:cation:H+ antiporter
LLIGAAQLFVTSIEHLAHGLGADELMLTLIIAPLATELPESSTAWPGSARAKTPLALGNITGAMVFQSMPLVAFGMVFTGCG